MSAIKQDQLDSVNTASLLPQIGHFFASVSKHWSISEWREISNAGKRTMYHSALRRSQYTKKK